MPVAREKLSTRADSEGMECEIDDGFLCDDVIDDCDCAEAEVDTIEGRARCFRCGRSWCLTSAELTRELEVQAAAYEAYADEMEAAGRSKLFEERK